MNRHKDVFVWSSDLINLMLDAFDDAEIARELCTTTVIDDDGFENVVDPKCWCRVAWPEHVFFPRYNSDASYHRADVSEIDDQSTVHSLSLRQLWHDQRNKATA